MRVIIEGLDKEMQQFGEVSLATANAARQVAGDIALVLMWRLVDKGVLDEADIAAMIDWAKTERNRSAPTSEEADTAEILGRKAQNIWLGEFIEELRALEGRAANRTGRAPDRKRPT